MRWLMYIYWWITYPHNEKNQQMPQIQYDSYPHVRACFPTLRTTAGKKGLFSNLENYSWEERVVFLP